MTSAPTTPPSATVITLRGEQELMARAGHLFAPREEFICAANDLSTWAATGSRDAAAARMRERIAAGVTVRKMYNPSALADPADAGHLLEVAAAGVDVRICLAELAHETIIIDRRVVILAGPPVAGVREYSVVFAPEVVAGVRSLFLTTWQAATELAEYLPASPPHLDEQGLTILRLLSAGQKDETAARSMGLSVRTYRRRVAELMTLLGAESRFQAGVRARALGLRW
ncbi:MAG TPA: DNA-binding response regulator [Pseudonocardiaceae bacterium]